MDEQIDLLSRAIESDRRTGRPSSEARGVAGLARGYSSPNLPDLLDSCWPLHPVVACLLGPISRRRFGQNQRSIFGFLNSMEPNGFQDFLRNAGANDLYTPDRLWDYLRVNLEPSIMASPDGHRWALAVDALERCHTSSGQESHLRLLKTIALVGMFRERSGLKAGRDLLELSLAPQDVTEISNTIGWLEARSLIIYRKFDDAYSIFDGSDFDIDEALRRALQPSGELDFVRLEELAGLQPIVAKRHYHESGALQWFDVKMTPLAEVEEAAAIYVPNNGAIGAFFLAIPAHDESDDGSHSLCRRAVNRAAEWDVVVGLPQVPWDITALARELLALERVRDDDPALHGDRVARKEINARLSDLQGYIESGLARAFDSALWHAIGHEATQLARRDLNSLASELAERRFPDAPRLQNELLNRRRPSSNAVAACNALLRHMALHEGKERLAIQGFSAERGLFESLLNASQLYQHTSDGWRFAAPELVDESGERHDPCGLAPAWKAALAFLEANANRTVSIAEIYDIWRRPPFGIKDGLLPILVVALILSKATSLALYRQGIFRAYLTDLDTDYLAKDPGDFQLRWMNLSQASRRLLTDIASIVSDMDKANARVAREPIDVARGLIDTYDKLHPWVKRTQRLSMSTKRLRQLFKQASDPNRLIFDDIPQALAAESAGSDDGFSRSVPDRTRDALQELARAYPSVLHRLKGTLLSELDVPNDSESMLAELRDRAANIRQLAGNHRLEAFIVRLTRFAGKDSDIEGLASLAANKPLHDWVDADVDRAAVELAALAQHFNRIEAFAHVKGRPDRRHAMAVVVGLKGRPKPHYDHFNVAEIDRAGVEELIARLAQALDGSGEDRRPIILAALAEISATYIDAADTSVPPVRMSARETVA